MADKKILLSYPHMCGKEEQYVAEAFASNWIAPLGPMVDRFEKQCAQLSGCQYPLATCSGTAAIHLALRLLDIQAGDLVFCSSLTFIASVTPALQLGAEIAFIDSAPNDWNMSPIALEKAFKWAAKEGKTVKAVIVAELYGQCPDLDKIVTLCKQQGVPIVEDAAEALGSTYKGRACGSIGDYGIYSFNGNKIITTSGGGMLLCPTQETRDRGFFLATQARDTAPWYQHSTHGYNYRLSNICAAIGVGQMEVLKDRIARRQNIYQTYKRELSDQPITMMPLADYCNSNCWLSVLTINKECSVTFHELMQQLAEKGIETRPVWKPLHRQPLFEGYKYFTHDESVSDDLFERGLCLPSCSAMTKDEQSFVVAALRETLSRA